MQISYYGLSCFRFTSKPGGRATDDIILYIDPLNEKGVRSVYGKADIVLCSQEEESCSADTFKGEAKVFDFPGEYSVKGINISGIDTSQEKAMNTIFSFSSESITIAHLGRARENFDDKFLEKLNQIDILFLPVGGNTFMESKKAAEIIRKIEPKIVIPMMYDLPGVPYKLNPIKDFLSEMGANAIDTIDKFVCRKKDLPEKGTEIVILASQR